VSHPAVRAVVADDSPTARALLVGVLSSAGIDVVGEATDGEGAVRLVRDLRPSVVVMDIDMPGVDGFEATRRIMAEAPTPIVIVTGSRRADSVAVSHRAIELGALTVQPKPSGPAGADHGASSRRLAGLVRAMADVKVVGRRTMARKVVPAPGTTVATTPAPPRPVPSTPARAGTAPLKVVGVGASTGGPVALHQFLSALPPDLEVPVLVVQHLPDGFVEGFVRWLTTAAALRVQVAQNMAPLGPGVHVAPHGCHLEITRTWRTHLVHTPPVHGFRPSVSTLFSSLAAHAGSSATAVVLTGMGSDGLEGARAIRARGGRVLVQDEDSSVVYGMPRAVAQAGLADVVGPVGALAREIADAAERNRWERSDEDEDQASARGRGQPGAGRARDRRSDPGGLRGDPRA
jgi:two-component system chemotaxis response regulator CheB